jgi:Putative transposase
LVRRRVVEGEVERATRFLADDLAEREPALAQLAAAATGPKVVRPLCVEDGGFSLHAAARTGAEDDVRRSNLFNCVLRPPIAQEHVTLTADSLVAIQLKKPFRDSPVSVEMDPLSLVSRLAASVHPPRFRTVRYGGVLAPHAKWRPLVVPPPPAPEANCHSLP